jgi:2'-5' RNA ligase
LGATGFVGRKQPLTSQMAKRHRLFFALEPDEKVRREIHAVQKKLDCNGRKVPENQFHITLAFLGMQPAEMIPEVSAIASRVPFSPCALVLDRFGIFRRAGVLWIGTTIIPAALQNFHQALLDELERADIGYDRKAWEPHLTLYRRLRNRPVIMDTVPVTWQLNQFSLVESINVKSGIEYCRQGCWKSGSSAIYP